MTGPARPGGAVTIRAVAGLAGVSPSTVSRALNAPELVNAVTRRRVLESAERLGYQPNRAARSLVLGRTANLGLIVPDIANPFFAPFIKAVQSRLRDSDYALFLADTDEDRATEVALAEAMAEQVDGLILCSPRLPAARLHATAARTPVVVAYRLNRTIPSVGIDHGPGIEQAVTHLRALGHRRCAYLTGPRGSWSNRQRLRHLTAACSAQGIRLTVLGPYEPRFSGGYRAADEVLTAEVTAVLAYNDLIALGVMSRLADRRVGVPRDISVIGVDDIPMASMTSPPLTTVSVPIAGVAQASASMLLSLLGAAAPRRAGPPDLATRLVIRSTTAPV
ncbi:LacI family DNA-binding transcriptional regulator [Actinomadura sp. HBU206391]|uniref:LacI family DNA-binding transcriptional regulator n=1 Tax=Actinomadura sp. HBU206391 TaxID=2731692 RepID=UPI002905DBFB|nr:LacI family DNA-binding transcriptional regulator [Actinomadura sp. HBU206391]